MNDVYGNPTRRIIADGGLSSLPEIVSSFSPKRILLVLGKSSFRGSPHYAALRKSLNSYTTRESDPVEHSPSISFVQSLWERLRSDPYDLVIGIGGGSVIDCAKAVRLLLGQTEGTLEEYVEKRREFARPGPPLIAIPTTAGTGSEVTPYSSLQTAARQKVSLTHPWIFPDIALIDPELAHSLPRYVTACSGLDALSQAIEALWSVRHNPFSDTHAARAVSLIPDNLSRILRNPGDRSARFAMSLASCEAGLAITYTRTTAVHAVSYPLTTFFNIPHGHACALTLPSFIRYNGPSLDAERGSLICQALAAASWEEAAAKVERLIGEAGLEKSLRRMGLTESGIEVVLENGFRSDRVINNPKKVTREDLHAILKNIF